MINISHYQCTLTVCRNLQTETYFVESPNLQYTQVYRVSYFNPTGIVLTALFFLQCGCVDDRSSFFDINEYKSISFIDFGSSLSD